MPTLADGGQLGGDYDPTEQSGEELMEWISIVALHLIPIVIIVGAVLHTISVFRECRRIDEYGEEVDRHLQKAEQKDEPAD